MEMILRELWAGGERKRTRLSLLAATLLVMVCAWTTPVNCEPGISSVNAVGTPEPAGFAEPAAGDFESDPLQQFDGLKVQRIGFEGVDPSRFDPLPERLAQIVGTPLTQENLARGLRAVYATGLFETVDAEAWREGEGVVLTFKGSPRTFIGTVSVNGAKGATINTQLERASRLQSGTRYSEGRLTEALAQMRQALADNGFHEPVITQRLTPKPAEQLIDISFQVASGPQAHLGTVRVNGDSGMSLEEFRRHGSVAQWRRASIMRQSIAP